MNSRTLCTTVDAICANGPLIQQAWEEDAEDE